MSDGGVENALRSVMVALDGAAIGYMVVGSFASATHGEPRTTRNLDLVMDPTARQLDQFLAAIDVAQFYVDADVARDALQRRSMFNLIEMTSGWKIDLIIRKERPFSIEELARRSPMRVVEIEVPTASAEDTIISKLEWAKLGTSARQLIDVAGILRVRGSALDLSYIERWVDELALREQWDRARTFAT